MVSYNGRHVLTWGPDGTARLWDARTGSPIGSRFRHADVYGHMSATFSRDGHRILTWGDTTARLWDAGTGAQIGPSLQHADGVSGAVFSSDESRILTWGYDGTARLWDARWGLAQSSPNAFVSAVCAELLGSPSLRRITEADARASSLLVGRVGEDVCASRGLFSFLGLR